MYIRVKAQAGATKEKFVKCGEDHFEISIKEPAERNIANGRIIELIAAHFGLPRGKVRIINGHHSPSKLISIDLD